MNPHLSTPTTRLTGDHLQVGYGKTEIIKDISITIPDGKITVLIGANACGKSTLLKTIARLLKPTQGQVRLDHLPLSSYPPKNLAKILGILPQSPLAPEGIIVADLISRGRFPYQKRFQGLSPSDYKAIEEAIEMMGIQDIANKDISQLSGGQRQRVWIAMALAQQTDILLLDEPTTYLDIAHQVEILDLLARINAQRATTIVMVLHDINLASRYAHHMIAIKSGAIVAQGCPETVITQSIMRSVFDLDSVIIEDPISKTPLVIPMAKERLT